jgi:hypothetical protein
MKWTLLGRWRVWRYDRELARMARYGRELSQTQDPGRARWLIDRLKSNREGSFGSLFEAVKHPNELVRLELARRGDPRVDAIFACVLDDLLEDPSPRVVDEAIRNLVAVATLETPGKLYPAVMLLRFVLHEQRVAGRDAPSVDDQWYGLLARMPLMWWKEPRAIAVLPLLESEARGANARVARAATLAIEQINKAAAATRP